jgi:NTP pyrophosphatase (non-canonical NTP hydrolase)
MSRAPFSIGADVWPGLAKLMEECGEVVQVGGKLQGTGGAIHHWDGTNLKERLEDEMGDAQGAMMFVIAHCNLDGQRINRRAIAKLTQFDEWHLNEPELPEANNDEPSRTAPTPSTSERPFDGSD